MGIISIPGGGGGGVKSDEVTATLSNVLAGHTALTSDSNDEIGMGVLLPTNVLVEAGGSIQTYDGTVN